MSTTAFYFKTIRKINAAFASLFSNIMLIRDNQDGSENQRILVPIEYGDGEKYVKRLQGDPEMLKKIQIVLPRLSYEMVGFSYDGNRKLNTNNKNFAQGASGNSALASYNPVPYDFNFNLTLYVRNVEDGNQIIEQILPYFTPEYTLKINLVPEMNMIKNIPIILNSVEQIIEADGDFGSEVRIVIWTLAFTVKAFIFGAIKDVKLISNTGINFINSGLPYSSPFSNFDGEGACCTGNISRLFTMDQNGDGDYQHGEIVYQGLSLDYAYASGKVLEWEANSKTLIITAICGDFRLNQPIIGTDSYAFHIPISSANNNVVIEFTAVPEPITATANSYYSANITFKELGA